ncbi:single-stranded-DNA-specific exonuclease RecJ [Granulosicoccaceae sp. 1_MG-2023]|nr:single-stranded-DNA-specific exonuclease RecJ [Granulosicoccaceae sp. 1_MG-2023]
MSVPVTIRRRPLPDVVTQGLGSHPVLDAIFAARGVRESAELSFALKDLPPPSGMAGIDEAVSLLVQALEECQRILIVGDYDADGATSTALAVTALRMLGAAEVGFLLPNRFDYGYGLSPPIVDLAAERKPDLLITVDNGIASVDGVARARELGTRVLVTDHHLPPEVLPEADAIVNPNRADDRSGLNNLAGVGVIFYVMLALRQALQQRGHFGGRLPPLGELLDIVAVGTVADVVPLDRINRILVEQGLRRIRAGQTRPGIEALIRVAGRSREALCAMDIGFGLGPRLNAAGRLEDMRIGVQCLLSEDAGKALELATELDSLNRRRREIEQEMRDEAEAILQSGALSDAGNPPALCLYEPHWHQGVVGILASRVKDRIHRPVIVFASDDNGQIKGSGRSIEGVHLRDALDAVATRQPGLISKFGGHAMAAGLSIAEADFDAFRQAFAEEVGERLKGINADRCYLTDGSLRGQDMTLPLAEALRFAAPWGQGFPAPLFDGEFEVVDARLLQDKHLKLRVRVPGDDGVFDAIAFNNAPDPLPRGQVRLVYRLEINEFRGERNVQLMVEYLDY